MTVQVRVALDKKREVADGPDDADVVITIAAGDKELDPTVAFMQGKLKAAGHTGVLFAALRSGEIARALARVSA